MARTHIDQLCNLSDRPTKQRLMAQIGSLDGLYEVDIRPTVERHSDRQRGYFHAGVLKTFHAFINQPGVGDGRHRSMAQCKDILVAEAFGTAPVIHPLTGEMMSQWDRPSTKDFTIEQYSELIEKSIAWLAGFGIEVPPPSLYYEEAKHGV